MPSRIVILVLFLRISYAFALPAGASAPSLTIPYNAYPPRTTPAVTGTHRPQPHYLPLHNFAHLFGFIPIPAVNVITPRRDLNGVLVRQVPIELVLESANKGTTTRPTIQKRQSMEPQQTQAAQAAIAASCVDSTGNDTYISSVRTYSECQQGVAKGWLDAALLLRRSWNDRL